MVRKNILLIFTVFLLGAGLLSGCIGGDEADVDTEDEDDGGEAQHSEDEGSIWGAVSSDQFMPLEKARVTLLTMDREEVGKEASTGANGEFTISFVQPGNYIVHVSAIGFESAQKGVTVVAGETAEVRLVLKPLPRVGPYAEEFDRVGSVGAAVAWQVEPPVVGCITEEAPVRDIKSCGGTRTGGEAGETRVGPVSSPDGWPGTSESDWLETDLEDLKTIMVEMRWTPAGPLGEQFQLDMMCSDMPRGSGGGILDLEHVCYQSVQGGSPLTIRFDEEHWLEHDYNFTGTWAARVFGAYGMLGTYDLTGVDVGLAYQQSFEIYWTVFHGEPAPEAYSRLPDA